MGASANESSPGVGSQLWEEAACAAGESAQCIGCQPAGRIAAIIWKRLSTLQDLQHSCCAWAQLREKAARAAGESADHAVPWKLDLAASAPAANASGLELESGCRLSDGAHCSSQCY